MECNDFFNMYQSEENGRRLAPANETQKGVKKYNRGRRAKSECKNLHYQKTKIQGVSGSKS